MNTLTDHPNAAAGLSQCDLILASLTIHQGDWVPMPDLARVGAGSESGFCMVHSRVADLRRRGHTIEHRNERHGGKTHSFYKLT